MKRIDPPLSIAMLIALVGATGCPPVHAAGPAHDAIADAVPLDALRLDALRGGYVLPSGLVVGFGVERLVSVNGTVVASTRIDVPDLGRITPAQAQSIAAFGGTRVLQVGQGETLVPGAAAGLVIQNALDGQRIGAMTTVDVSVGTLGLLQDLNLASSLQSALINASGSP